MSVKGEPSGRVLARAGVSIVYHDGESRAQASSGDCGIAAIRGQVVADQIDDAIIVILLEQIRRGDDALADTDAFVGKYLNVHQTEPLEARQPVHCRRIVNAGGHRLNQVMVRTQYCESHSRILFPCAEHQTKRILGQNPPPRLLPGVERMAVPDPQTTRLNDDLP